MSGLSTPVYELVSMGLRYWLLFLAVMIVWRAIRLMQKENRLYKKTMRQLPDAGLVGELVDLETGQAFQLPREGMIGSGRASDIRLPGIRRRALELVFRSGYGLKLIPSHRKHHLRLDEELIASGGDYALHGSVLDMGGKAYRFRLFEGLDVPEHQGQSYAPEAEEAEAEDVWAQQMVMQAPPPTPPGAQADEMMPPPWPRQEEYVFQEEALPYEDYSRQEPGASDPYLPQQEVMPQEEEPQWQPSGDWEGQDGYH